MDAKLWMYLCYLAISIGLTAWVARALYRNGQVFLDDALGDERLARSVNHLLVVGFYLVNLGYAMVAIRLAGQVTTPASAVEALSLKVGLVLLVLGAAHFFNLFVLNRYRRRRQLVTAPPPVAPWIMTPGPVPPPAPMPPHTTPA